MTKVEQKQVNISKEFVPNSGEGILDSNRASNFLSLVILIVVVFIYFRQWKVNITNTTPLEVTVENTTPIDVNITNTTPIIVKSDLEYYEDAFARLRVSEQFTLGDYKHVYLSDPTYVNYTENGGSVTYNQDQSLVNLSLDGSVNSRATHQTRIYHHYMPGKGQFLFSSFVFGPAQTGVTKRTGYFDDREGVFLQMDGSGVFSWVIRTAVTGSPGTILESALRNTWYDPCDGSGPSGVNLDFTKSQLIFIDFQWLGVGAVRCGFVHRRKIVLSHVFFHSNVLSTPYIQNPSLPVRCECVSSLVGSVGSMKQICNTILSEGGYAESGADFSVNSGHLGRDCDIGGTRYPLLAIRLKNSFKGLPNRVMVRLTNFTIYNENHGILWELWRLESSSLLTGLVTWADVNSDISAVEYSIHPSAISITTSAVQLSSGFSPAGNANAGNNAVNVADPSKARKAVLSQNFDSSDSQIFVVVAVPVGTGTNFNANSFASIQWREIY